MCRLRGWGGCMPPLRVPNLLAGLKARVVFLIDLTGWGSDKNDFMPRLQQEGCQGAHTETSLLRTKKAREKKGKKIEN